MRWLGTFLWLFCASAFAAQPATDSTYAASWGPAIQSKAPLINAPDQRGQIQTLKTLVGRNGVLLCFVRSADW